MGNIFSSSCRSCCDKYEGLDETNTKNDERSSVDGNQPIESTEYTNLVTMTAKFVYIHRPRDLTTVDRFIVKKTSMSFTNSIRLQSSRCCLRYIVIIMIDKIGISCRLRLIEPGTARQNVMSIVFPTTLVPDSYLLGSLKLAAI